MDVCIVTSSRADWGLLEPLAQKIDADPDMNLNLVATGSHLSGRHGNTVDHINIPHGEIEILMDSDSPSGITDTAGLALLRFGPFFAKKKPDLIILLGDRYEIMAAAMAAHIHRIPIAHIHGGEVTAGAYDDAFRHSITKMSQLHFPATETYRERIIQLGEHPDTVFNVGALGCDGFLGRREYRKPSGDIVVLVHSETMTSGYPEIFTLLLNEIDKRDLSPVVITGGNDVGSDIVRRKIERFESTHRFLMRVDNLSREDFLDLLRNSDAIVGNSSSGIIEAPALGVPTINIGDRQKGREMALSVLGCEATKDGMWGAFEYLYSDRFQGLMRGYYGLAYTGGDVSGKILETIKENFDGIEMKKGFYDLP